MILRGLPSFFMVTNMRLNPFTGEFTVTFSSIPNSTSLSKSALTFAFKWIGIIAALWIATGFTSGSTNKLSGSADFIIARGCILQLFKPDFTYSLIINSLKLSLDMLSNPATSLCVIGSGASALTKQPHIKIPFFNGKYPYI